MDSKAAQTQPTFFVVFFDDGEVTTQWSHHCDYAKARDVARAVRGFVVAFPILSDFRMQSRRGVIGQFDASSSTQTI